MKRTLCLILALCLLSGALCFGASAAQPGFSDVSPEDWFYEPVMSCARSGLVLGNADGSYAPNRALSWAETVVFAVRLTQHIRGERIYTAADHRGQWYDIYVEYARANHLLWYVPQNVNVAVTRAEAAEIFANVLGWGSFEKINEVPAGYFKDVSGSSAKSLAVYTLAEAGIVIGMGNGLFGTQSYFKRSEVAAIVGRIAGISPKMTLEVEPAPAHSEYYIEGVSTETVTAWFAEVCLDTEFGDKDGAMVVQKWTEPIYYIVHGSPTERDLEVLESFAAELNAIENFPGIYPAPNEWQSNLDMYFVGETEFVERLGSDYQGSWGGVRYWYDGNNEIYSCIIGQRSDISQYYRDSIILEEIYNGLGPVQDTTVRSDSIIYQWSNENFSMTKEDILLLKLLYHPDMKPGYTYEQCADIIAQLYY